MSHYTLFDYYIFLWWESGVWWRVNGAVCYVHDEYRSTFLS